MPETARMRTDTLGAIARVGMAANLDIEDYTGLEEIDTPLRWKCSMNFTKSSPLPESEVLDSALCVLGDKELDRTIARSFNMDTFTPTCLGIPHVKNDTFANDMVVLTREVYDSMVDAAFDLMNADLKGKPGFEGKVLTKDDRHFDDMPFKQIFGAPISIGEECSIRAGDKVYNPFDSLLKVRLKVQRGLTIAVSPSRNDIVATYPKNEWTAIETLREMISEKEFRKYLTEGFLLVKGLSGKIYQIFRTKTHVKVWHGGQVVEEVCSYIKEKSIPPTDKVISFKAIIETCEDEFRKLGNVYPKKYSNY